LFDGPPAKARWGLKKGSGENARKGGPEGVWEGREGKKLERGKDPLESIKGPSSTGMTCKAQKRVLT